MLEAPHSTKLDQHVGNGGHNKILVDLMSDGVGVASCHLPDLTDPRFHLLPCFRDLFLRVCCFPFRLDQWRQPVQRVGSRG